MKFSWPITLVLVTMSAWTAYSKGFSNGQQSVPAFIEEGEKDRISRESEHHELMDHYETIEFIPPSIEECVPIMEGEEELDVREFCVSLLNEYDREYQDAMQDGRSQYD